MNIQNDLYVLLPELILAVGAMALLLIGAVRGDKSANTLTILAVLLIGASAYLSMVVGDGTAFGGAFVMDSFARFTTWRRMGRRNASHCSRTRWAACSRASSR